MNDGDIKWYLRLSSYISLCPPLSISPNTTFVAVISYWRLVLDLANKTASAHRGRIYASLNWATMASDIHLSPFRLQSIMITDAAILWTFSTFRARSCILNHCLQMAAILFRTQWVKTQAVVTKTGELYHVRVVHVWFTISGCWENKSVHHVHDDVIKWKHFPRYWPFVRGIHRGPVNSPHKGKWRRELIFSLICASINGWVNNGEAGDLRCHRAHYDVIVMYCCCISFANVNIVAKMPMHSSHFYS